jgi:hypothetical protein
VCQRMKLNKSGQELSKVTTPAVARLQSLRLTIV